MGLIANLFAAADESAGPIDDYWYGSLLGTRGAAGVRVDAETAQLSSVVFSCVQLIAETIATMPTIVYRRTDGDSREKATDHPLYRLLHDRPNSYQTPFEFKELMQRNVLLRGNAIAVRVPGPSGSLEELLPWNPNAVKIERIRLGRLSNGVEVIVPRYRLQLSDQTDVVLNRDDVFHLRGFTRDGVTGLSVIDYARETIGLTLAQESYASRFFSQDARPGGVLQHPNRLSPEAAKRLKRDWELMHTGLENAHRVAVLEEGLTFNAVGMTNEAAQYLQSRQFQIADVARWFRVPLHMVGSMEKSTSWGTGLEQLGLGFLVYTLMPHITRWEEAASRDLITDTDTYYVEFLADSILRGDLKSRSEAYAIARQWGWLSVNEIRQLENRNPIEGGDEYMTPLNMGDAAGGRQAIAALPAPAVTAHHATLLRQSAARILRKETTAMSKLARRVGDNTDGWKQGIETFYGLHGRHIAEELGIPLQAADVFATEQADILNRYGPGALANWSADGLDRLIELVTEATTDD